MAIHAKAKAKAEFISVEADLNQAMKFLSEIDGNQNRMRKRVLSAVGAGAKQAVKKNYNSFLNKRSGTLYKSISKKLIKSGKAVVIYPAGRSTRKVLYGYALAEGSTIEARHNNFLTFKIGDKWFKKKKVKLPIRNFITEPAERYLHSGAIKETISKQIDKELEKAAKTAANKK